MVCINTCKDLNLDTVKELLLPFSKDAIPFQLWGFKYFDEIIKLLSVEITEQNSSRIFEEAKKLSLEWWDSVKHLHKGCEDLHFIVPEMSAAAYSNIDDISAYFYGYFCALSGHDDFMVYLGENIFLRPSEIWFHEMGYKSELIAEFINYELYNNGRPVFVHQDVQSSAFLGMMNIQNVRGQDDTAYWSGIHTNIYTFIMGFWGNVTREYDVPSFEILKQVKNDYRYVENLKRVQKV